MNKYELTVVLNVKLEDEERAAAIEKVKVTSPVSVAL